MSYRPLRSILVLVILVFAALPSFAADSTADLLGATFVKDYIRLSTEPDPDHPEKLVIVAAPDSFDENAFHAADGRTFSAKGQITVLIVNFNPLKQVWTVEGKKSVDPNFNAIKQLLEDLKSIQETFNPATKAAASAPVLAEAANPDCIRLRQLIKDANDALFAPGFSASDLKKIVDEATGFEGVRSARGDLKAAFEKLRQDNTKARSALDSIRSEFGSQNGHPPLKSCASISSGDLVDYIAADSNADRVIARREALARSLEGIRKSLEQYENAQRWRGATKSDFVYTTITPTFENQVTVDASLKTKTLELAGDTITDTTSDTAAATAQFMMRRDSFVVPERAAAVVYNRLTYPTYGTLEKDGKTTVQRTDDTKPLNAAMLVNFITRLGRSSPVYPMLQIGVSTAKDYPALLFGAGLRFTAPVAFSLSAGGMVTRYKDLDKSLKVGDAVTGTDEINKHLQYKTSPVVPYVAIQMKF